MTPAEMRDQAVELFKKRMHCSQAVLAVGLAKMGLDEPELVRAMGALGGGIASTGRACGCLNRRGGGSLPQVQQVQPG